MPFQVSLDLYALSIYNVLWELLGRSVPYSEYNCPAPRSSATSPLATWLFQLHILTLKRSTIRERVGRRIISRCHPRPALSPTIFMAVRIFSRSMRVLVANRGEIALRVMRAASELDIQTVALSAPGDEAALHVASASDGVVRVPSYLETAAIVEAAKSTGCDAVHPGYGFLSESAPFAQEVEDAGLKFVGPTPSTIALLGDKVAARQLAASVGVPVAAGSDTPCADPAAVRAAIAAHGLTFPVFLKAVGGGGGRGMRPVASDADLDSAFAACAREATAVGLEGGLFVEQGIVNARHVEVQLVSPLPAKCHPCGTCCLLPC